MSVQRIVWESVKMTLGLGHFVLQTGADVCVEAESQYAKRVGFYDGEINKMRKLEDVEVSDYKEGRRILTREVQDGIKKKASVLRERVKYNGKFSLM